MTRIDPGLEGAILRLATSQHGLVAQHQLTTLGASRFLARSRIRAGQWDPVGVGVYRVGAAPLTFDRRCMTAVLSIGGSLLSHRTACRKWDLIPTRTVPIEVSVPRATQVLRRGIHVHRSRDLHLADARLLDGIPVTGPVRSVLDLGAVEPTWVRKAVWELRRLHGVPWNEILGSLVDHALPGRRGVGPLRAVVAEHYGDQVRDSTTEDVAYGILCDSGRVPPPLTQVPVVCADGVEVTIDLGWPEWGGFVEVFGGHHLYDEDLLHLDMHRQNQIRLAGHELLIYSGRLLHRQPDQFVVDVMAMLLRRGWSPGLVPAAPTADP